MNNQNICEQTQKWSALFNKNKSGFCVEKLGLGILIGWANKEDCEA